MRFTGSELMSMHFPPEYANITSAIHHVVIEDVKTACGRSVKESQITTIPDGRLCERCSMSKDRFVRGVISHE